MKVPWEAQEIPNGLASLQFLTSLSPQKHGSVQWNIPLITRIIDFLFWHCEIGGVVLRRRIKSWWVHHKENKPRTGNKEHEFLANSASVDEENTIEDVEKGTVQPNSPRSHKICSISGQDAPPYADSNAHANDSECDSHSKSPVPPARKKFRNDVEQSRSPILLNIRSMSRGGPKNNTPGQPNGDSSGLSDEDGFKERIPLNGSLDDTNDNSVHSRRQARVAHIRSSHRYSGGHSVAGSIESLVREDTYLDEKACQRRLHHTHAPTYFETTMTDNSGHKKYDATMEKLVRLYLGEEDLEIPNDEVLQVKKHFYVRMAIFLDQFCGLLFPLAFAIFVTSWVNKWGIDLTSTSTDQLGRDHPALSFRNISSN